MPQSLSRVLVHLVFSTKNRQPLIGPEQRRPLFAYLAGALKGLDSPAIEIGGVADHVHILFVLARTRSQSEVVEEVKKESSKWAKQHVHPEFYWQNGFGAFSVSPSKELQVVSYIQTQEEHHRPMTFQEELRILFRKNGLEWDERYVWD